MKFTVPGEPQGKARARTVRGGAHVHSFTPEKTVLYENLVKVSFMDAAKGAFSISEGAPYSISITAYFGIPKSTSKKRAGLMLDGLVLPTKKPDGDNILKVVCDALNTVAWHDDAQVVDSEVHKRYASVPRLEIEIHRIKE